TVIAGPEANLFMMRGGAQRLTNNHAFGPMAEELRSPNLLIALDGARHKHMRRLLQRSYSREAMERNLPALAAAIEGILRGLEQKKPIGMRQLMQRLITEQVALAALGRSVTDACDDAAAFSSTLVGACLGRWPRWHLRDSGYRQAKARLTALAEKILEERRA